MSSGMKYISSKFENYNRYTKFHFCGEVNFITRSANYSETWQRDEIRPGAQASIERIMSGIRGFVGAMVTIRKQWH